MNIKDKPRISLHLDVSDFLPATRKKKSIDIMREH